MREKWKMYSKFPMIHPPQNKRKIVKICSKSMRKKCLKLKPSINYRIRAILRWVPKIPKPNYRNQLNHSTP